MGYAIWDVSHGIGDKPRGMCALLYAIGQTGESHKQKSGERYGGRLRVDESGERTKTP